APVRSLCRATRSWSVASRNSAEDTGLGSQLRPFPRAGVDETRARHRTRELDDGGASAGSVLLEVAAGLELAGEGMADDSLGQLPRFDHRVEIDARVDAELLAEEDEVFGRDVPRGALVGGEGAPAHPCHRPLEPVDSHLHDAAH